MLGSKTADRDSIAQEWACKSVSLAGLPCDKTHLDSVLQLKPALFVWGKSNYSLQSDSCTPLFPTDLVLCLAKTARGSFCTSKHIQAETFPPPRPHPAEAWKSSKEERKRERAFSARGRRELPLTLDTQSSGPAEAPKTGSPLLHCPLRPQTFIEHLLGAKGRLSEASLVNHMYCLVESYL